MNNTTNTTSSACTSFIVHCLFSDAERYAVVVAMVLIAVASLVGNVLVCCAFFTDNKKGSALTLASLHLAIANLLITIFWGPIVTFYLYVIGEWKLGFEMCKLVACMQDAGVVASLLHLLVVTVEKYLAVCFPFRFRRKKSHPYRYILLVVWLIAVGESIFYIQFKNQRTMNGKEYCIEDWPNTKTFTIVTLAKTLFFFLTLFAIMVFLGLTIFGLRFGKGNFRPEASRRDESSWRKKRTRQARAVKILVVMLVSVMVCWTPFHSLSLVAIANGMDDTPMRDIQIIFTVSLVAFFAVCTIHPIIFLFFNRQGKDFIQKNLRRLSFSKRQSLRSGQTLSELGSAGAMARRRLSARNRATSC